MTIKKNLLQNAYTYSTFVLLCKHIHIHWNSKRHFITILKIVILFSIFFSSCGSDDKILLDEPIDNNITSKLSSINNDKVSFTIYVDNQSGEAKKYYTELVKASTGEPLQVETLGPNGNGYKYLDGINSITYSNIPEGLEVAFVVYDNGNVLSSSDIFITGTNPDIVILPNSEPIPQIAINVQITIDGITRDICNNAVWYKECPGGNCSSVGCNPDFIYAGHLTPESPGGILVTTLPVIDGNPYCMRVWYNGVTPEGDDIEQSIDFDMDFALAQSVPGTTIASTNSYVEYLFDGNKYIIGITGGLEDVNSCPITDPEPIPEIAIHVQITIDKITRDICNNAVWYKECPGGNCSSVGCNPDFIYAGHLTPESPGGILVTALPVIDGNPYCMRVWYNGVSPGGGDIEQSIDFDMDFALAHSVPE